MNTKANDKEPIFTISRTFDAPRELVWKALTEPERLIQWFRPKGFKGGVVKMDFCVGGMFHYCSVAPDGQKIWGKCVYRDIKSLEKIIFVNSFSDEKGNVTRHPMNKDWPLELLTTYTLIEHEGKTTFTIQWSPINPTGAELKTFEEGTTSMNQGWSGTLDQFNEYLLRTSKEDSLR